MKIRNTYLAFMSIVILTLLAACNIPAATSTDAEAPIPAAASDDSDRAMEAQSAGPGAVVYTYIQCAENGRIAVRIDVPAEPRYGESAPVVVVASTWFVDKYNLETTPFHLEFNPVDVGAISISHLWPGKTDPQSGVHSEGTFDFGGPDSLAALRDTIRFALGVIPDVDGRFLHELIRVQPLYENVGMFASSHAGVVATNVMAYYGESLTGLKYFVGRENPTMAEMYPLEIGHWTQHQRTALVFSCADPGLGR
ncbi:MAG: hypothetical protein P8Z41_11570 [Anaerolineales bacterium]